MSPRLAPRRLRAALTKAQRSAEGDPWSAYLFSVEPVLAREVRVHRFAQVPVIAAPRISTAPVAVWIDSEGDGSAEATTRSVLAAGTAPTDAILTGPLSEALAGTRAERVLLVAAGDLPAPLALERLGQAAALVRDAAVITCDEDEWSRGTPARRRPRFRPGPSPDRWLACDDSGSMMLVDRRRAAAAAADDALGHDGWRHELALALAGPGGAGHAHVPLLLNHRAEGARTARMARDAADRALRSWEPGARFDHGSVRRVRRSLIGEPRAQIIVCFRDQAQLTRQCVASLLRETNYERFGITLVDNGSVEPETAALLETLSRNPQVRIVRDDRPFNFAALNNAAAAGTDSEFLVFLNNDTELIDGDWLEILLEEAQRPEVGAVAPMLLFDDDTVQHAGAALGLHGYAGHPFAGLAPHADTPFGRADEGTRNWLAVTAACMVVSRTKFDSVGGFDEVFVVAGNDVDLCLRLTAAGHRSLCVPHVRLRHHESRSRGMHIDPGDFAASERSYGAFRSVGDPFYNPNLTLRGTDCRVRAPDEGLA